MMDSHEEIKNIKSFSQLEKALRRELFDKKGNEKNAMDDGLTITRLVVLMALEYIYTYSSFVKTSPYDGNCFLFVQSADAWLNEDHNNFLESSYYKQMLLCMHENSKMPAPASTVMGLMFQPFYMRRTRYERFCEIFNFMKPSQRKVDDDFYKTLLANIKLSLIYRNYNLDTGSFPSGLGE